jgi:hypothetical protein
MTSVFCNFYIRVDRETLVALDVGSVAFKAEYKKYYKTFIDQHLKLLNLSLSVIVKYYRFN